MMMMASSTSNGVPPPPVSLTASMIQSITGEGDLATLEELEIIFNPIQELGGLEQCNNLKTLSMINCGLMRISNLAPVRYTLERLCLSQQELTKIDNLDLPNLRELLLHQNRITKIENLEGCPKLQRLWLWSNQITKLENLQSLASLRELWIQENQISTITGLDSLVHLERLALAGNRIAEYKEVQRLTSLPALVDVSFSDPHFGDCPIVDMDGYWSFVLCYLKKVKWIDGVEMTDHERDVAEDAYVQAVLKFNEKIEQVEREHQREAASIEERRRTNVSHIDVLRKKLGSSFKELEMVVQEGRASILEEHARQRQVRESNMKSLEVALMGLERRYAEEVDRRIEEEQRLLAQVDKEEQMFHLHEAKIEAERDQALFISHLQYGTQGRVACQELCRASVDFQYLHRQFTASQSLLSPLQGSSSSKNEKGEGEGLGGAAAANGGGGGTEAEANKKWQILRAYRLLMQTFPHDTSSFHGPGCLSTRIYFAATKAETLLTTCISGFSTNESNGAGLLLFASNPSIAWQLAQGQPSSSSASQPHQASSTYLPTTFPIVLTCRAHLQNVSSLSTSWDGQPRSLPALLQMAASRFPATAMALLVRYHHSDSNSNSPSSTRGGGGRRSSSRRRHGEEEEDEINHMISSTTSSNSPFFLLVRRRVARNILPEYHLLCADSQMAESLKDMEEIEEEMMTSIGRPARDTATEEVLAGLKVDMEKEVGRYLESLWEEVEPEVGERLRQADGEVRQREEVLGRYVEDVEEERRTQEMLLRSMKGGGGSGGSSNGGGMYSVRGGGEAYQRYPKGATGYHPSIGTGGHRPPLSSPRTRPGSAASS